jgi:predicted TIM-barrel fold metal-dependent hydrolase
MVRVIGDEGTAMVDFPVFDADNHYYEALDAFTRHLDPSMKKRGMQWATIDGKQRLLVGGQVNRFIPNPTFDPVSKPGALTEYFRAKAGVSDMRAAFGELEPMSARPEYRDREARLKVMDEQGLEATLMLPTLAVGMETSLEHDPEALMASFTAFNRWLDEDWGFNHQDRIYAAPYITLTDVDWAIRELEFALERKTGVVLMRPGPVLTRDGRRSPGDPRHDAFWARLNESGVTLVVHGGDSSYGEYEQLWGLTGELEAFRVPTLKRLLSASPIHDMMASIIADVLFERHPNLRIATIETGSGWVKPLLKRLQKAAIQQPDAFNRDPHDLFLEHVWVSPFFEDDVLGLVDTVGPDRVVFGSDWPHAEGLADPVSFVKEIDGLDDVSVRKIMHDNARMLVTPQPA